jgi:flagellar motility protein MotE (MotC chaperone)
MAPRFPPGAGLALALLLAAGPAGSAETTAPAKPAPAASNAPAADAMPVSPVENAASHSGIERRALTEEARQYCVNIRDAAVDARIAWQAETMRELEKQLADQVAALEAKRAEYEMWLKKREEFLRRAREDIVAIYARMRPDAAAGQLAGMDEDTAVAVLAKLSARNAGAILNEMEPARAAQLANRLAGVSGLSMRAEKLKGEKL